MKKMKTKARRKVLSVFITLAMLISLLPMSFPVSAETDNQYVVRSLNGEIVTEELCDIPTATTLTDETSWGSGFYVADGNVELSAVTVTGDAKLILKDGCELTVTGGIAVNEGKSLEIFAQSGSTGSLTANGSEASAGIGGGGNITIHGGKINASGGSEEELFGGAGIGGSGHVLRMQEDYEYSETEELVFTNAGKAGTVCIYGGDITAEGGYHSAGIGGGCGCDGGNISIYGGNITAEGKDGAPGIGCGMADCIDMYFFDTNIVPVTGGNITISESMEVTDADENPVFPDEGKTWAQTLTGSFYTVCKNETTSGEEALPVVEYLYYDKTKEEFVTGKCDTYTVVNSVTRYNNDWTDGWYVVEGTVDGSWYRVNGNVNLILTDGCELIAKQGIRLEHGNTLTIYAQSGGTGTLNAESSLDAAIGSKYYYATLQSGNLKIHGGIINAESKYGAGIGGACGTGTRIDSGDLEVYGGTVYAKSKSGAGIGGGFGEGNCNGGSGGKVNIYGGSVTAESIKGAGIGGGGTMIDHVGKHYTYDMHGGAGYKVNIYGGTVTVKSIDGAGIGGGFGYYGGACGYVNIYGGFVDAQSVTSSGIGYGYGKESVETINTHITLGENITVCDSKGKPVILPDGGSWDDALNGIDHVTAFSDPVVPYRYYTKDTGKFNTGYCFDGNVIGSDTTEWGKTGTETWYVAKDTVNISERVTVSGNVNLILSYGCELTAKEGITVDGYNSITIYAQEPGTGVLNAGNEFSSRSGIGSIGDQMAGKIHIHGGNITAKSMTGAGIGGSGRNIGNGGSISTVYIYGGNVTAKSKDGAGIGGGGSGTGGIGGSVDMVYIYGGNVSATSKFGAGIGGGKGIAGGGSADNVCIFGGDVTAESEYGAGIGGGESGGEGKGGNGGTVFIRGGNVTAKSKEGAGIGGGEGNGGNNGGDGRIVNISGGNVTAESENGSSIGGGNGYTKGNPADVTLGGNAFVYDKEGEPVTLPEDSLSNLLFGDMNYARIEAPGPTVPGAQIRISLNAVNTSLRFVGEISEKLLMKLDDENNSMLDNKSFSEDYGYGFIVLPSHLLGGDDLTFETPDIAVVPANNVYEVGKDYVRFTVCINMIIRQNALRNYTVRPYVRYTDGEGNTQTVYGEQYATNHLAMSEAMYKDLRENPPQAALNVFSDVDSIIY